MINFHQARAPRNGTVAVEVAICLPILFMFLFGCYELGNANMMLHATESSAYEAARIGIVPGAKEQEIKDAAGFVLNSVGIRDFSIKVTPRVITAETEKVKVEVTVPYDTNSISVSKIFLTDPVFKASCELNRETL